MLYGKMKIPKTITEEEFNEICNKVKNKKTKLAFYLGFYQGLRVSEVINLKPEHIDMDGGFINLKQGKGGNDRDIPLMPPIKHGLRYLPITVTRQALHKAIKKYAKQAIGKDIGFHTLRHSCATYYLIEKKVDIRFVQRLLGHARLSTTQIYTHVTPKDLKDVFERAWK